jgi:antitoxin (DNA-binding transcriptional repressor) of toxin-antitoxin stability system
MRVIIVNMAVIHISEAEAARDLHGLLARVRAGEEIVIEKEASPAVVLRVAERPLRRLSESLRLAKEHGSTVTLDGGFARDLEAVVNSHPEPLENPWG